MNQTHDREYEPAAASALVFDSPVTSPYPMPGLARAPREPQAFLGYDQTISETYVVYTDDNQNDLPYLSSYNREAVSAKIGTRSR